MKTYRVVTRSVLGYTTVELLCRKNGTERRIICRRVADGEAVALTAEFRRAAEVQGFTAA